jgi:hypothetical protein
MARKQKKHRGFLPPTFTIEFFMCYCFYTTSHVVQQLAHTTVAQSANKLLDSYVAAETAEHTADGMVPTN